MSFKELETEFWSGKDIIEKYHNKELWIPRYQRSFVWDNDKQKKFMQSLSKGWPVGVVLVHKKDDRYFIMDGLQRTTTLVKYSQHWETHPVINNKEFLEKIKKNHIANNGKSYIDDIISIVNNLFSEIVKFYNQEYFDNNDYFNIVSKEERLSQLWNKVFGPRAEGFKNALMKFLAYFDDEIKLAIPKIDEYKILAQIWEGAAEDAPEIFQRINQEGEKLSKLLIIASSWKRYNHISWESQDFEKKFKEINSKRFKSLFDSQVINKTQIEGSNEKSVFGALEIIYYIAHEVCENILDGDFKKIFYEKQKQSEKNKEPELKLESILILVNTFLTYFKKMVEPSTLEKFDITTENYLSSEKNIQEAIRDISYHINKFIEIIKFAIVHESGKNYQKIIGDKKMFWTTLFALNLKDKSISAPNKIYKFLIKNFVVSKPLVKTGDNFNQTKTKVTNNAFADDMEFSYFENDQKELFEKEFYKPGKKNPTKSTHWEKTLINKILYLKFLHQGEDPKSLVFLQYINDGDFGKNHTDLRNYNFYSNYAFFPKRGSQKPVLDQDYLLDPNKNKWLEENWDQEGQQLVDDIHKHLSTFEEAKSLSREIEMNKALLNFLKKRKDLMVETLKYYLEK